MVNQIFKNSLSHFSLSTSSLSHQLLLILNDATIVLPYFYFNIYITIFLKKKWIKNIIFPVDLSCVKKDNSNSF